MEQRIDLDVLEKPDKHNIQGVESHASMDMRFQGYCLNCRYAFTQQELDDHSGCEIQLISSMVADAQTEHAAWQQFQIEVPTLIQNECRRVDDAAESAIAAVSKIIRDKSEELKNALHRCFSQQTMSDILQHQLEHRERLAELCRLKIDECYEWEFTKLLKQIANRVPYPAPQSCVVFCPAIAEAVALAKFMFLGRVLGSLDDKKSEAIRRIEGQEGIHMAAERGSEELVALHIIADEKSVDLLSTDLRFENKSIALTPLIVAIRCGHLEVVRLLLKAKASVELAVGSGCTPLNESVFGAMESKFDPNVTKAILCLLLDFKADVNKFWGSKTAFHFVIEKGREDLVALLLDAKANVNLRTRTRQEESCLVLAADNIPILRLLAETPALNINARNQLGQTALQVAMAKKWNEVADFLRSQGAS